MSEVLLLYDGDCPNVTDCRTNLIKAFVASGTKPSWREVDRSADDTPPRLRGYGSPTVLVGGFDVAGEQPGDNGASCRLYQTVDGGVAGAPSVEQIAERLSEGFQDNALVVSQGSRDSDWTQMLAALPAIGAALLPNITCPACWPGYAAVLSSIGLGFLPSNRYLLPLNARFFSFTCLCSPATHASEAASAPLWSARWVPPFCLSVDLSWSPARCCMWESQF